MGDTCELGNHTSVDVHKINDVIKVHIQKYDHENLPTSDGVCILKQDWEQLEILIPQWVEYFNDSVSRLLFLSPTMVVSYFNDNDFKYIAFSTYALQCIKLNRMQMMRLDNARVWVKEYINTVISGMQDVNYC